MSKQTIVVNKAQNMNLSYTDNTSPDLLLSSKSSILKTPTKIKNQ